MAEENTEGMEQQESAPPKKGKSKLLIIIIVLLAVLGGGGFFAYSKFLSHPSGEGEKGKDAAESEVKEEETKLISFDPFLVNLTEQGRFLKMTLQFEIINPEYEKLVQDRMPIIRDAVITLLSSKSSDSIATPEGKFQIKDELLMRANAAIGKDIFKNVYFTEFVMQ